MTAAQLRTVHVGVGGRGRWPLDVLSDDERFRPVALVDVSAEAVGWARQRTGLPSSACFADVEAALVGVEADALVVCAPTRTHAAFCRLGFGAGKHVLVEKGMTLDWAEARALVAEADAAGVRFCVAQNYRYTAEVRTLAAALDSGRYGAPHLIDLLHHRHRPEPRTLDYPGAMVWDMACHHLDNLVYLFGPLARATAVTHGAPWSAYRYDAGVSAVLELAAGPVCTYLLTHQATVPHYRWVLQSERGALRNAGGGWEWLPRGPIEQFSPHGPPEPLQPAPPLRSEQGVVDDWYRYVVEGVEPGISGRRNLETLAACELVLRSAALGRAVARSELD
ncbi:MAG TPA: Gfo/Idh/MocA family oxidoreductase [Chloroflexota bacterium]|jgi:predicted dehydrogenase